MVEMDQKVKAVMVEVAVMLQVVIMLIYMEDRAAMLVRILRNTVKEEAPVIRAEIMAEMDITELVAAALAKQAL